MQRLRKTNELTLIIILAALIGNAYSGGEIKAKGPILPIKPPNARQNKNDIFKPITNHISSPVGKEKTVVTNVIEKANNAVVRLKSDFNNLFKKNEVPAVAAGKGLLGNAPAVNIGQTKQVIVRKKPDGVLTPPEKSPLARMEVDVGKPSLSASNVVSPINKSKAEVQNNIKAIVSPKPTDRDPKQKQNIVRVKQPPMPANNKVEAKRDNLALKKNAVVNQNNKLKPGLKGLAVEPAEAKIDTKGLAAAAAQKNTATKKTDLSAAPVAATTVPLEIVWELGAAKKFLEAENRLDEYSYLKGLLEKAGKILKMYVHIPSTEKLTFMVPPGDKCGFKFPAPYAVNGHMLMLTQFFVPTNAKERTINAKARLCAKNAKLRTVVGVLEINAEKLLKETDGATRHKDFLMTLVHEVFHALAFYQTTDEIFEKAPLKDEYENLKLIKKVNTKIYDEGHWQDPYIPNDIMTPVSRSDSLMTIFSLEVLELSSETYKGQRRSLPDNNFLSKVENLEDFFNYKCKDDEKPKYNEFCAKDEVLQDVRQCSQDYVFHTYCNKEPKSNKCHLRVVNSLANCMDPIVSPKFKTYPFEYRGHDSRCFGTENGKNSYCLKYQVVDDDIQILIGKKTYVCKEENQTFEIDYKLPDKEYYPIKIKCPMKADFLEKHAKTSCPNNCNFNGFCSKGTCLCFEGFDPRDHCKSELRTTDHSLIFAETLESL